MSSKQDDIDAAVAQSVGEVRDRLSDEFDCRSRGRFWHTLTVYPLDSQDDAMNLGNLRVEPSGEYLFEQCAEKLRYRLVSPRIPSRSRYGGSSGWRDYRSVAAAVAGIRKFCMPVSDDETRGKVLRGELSEYRTAVSRSYTRSLHLDGSTWGLSPPVDRFVMLLASDIPQDYLEGREFMRVLIRKHRVHVRFRAWMKERFIDPRQTELDGLDLSNERLT